MLNSIPQNMLLPVGYFFPTGPSSHRWEVQAVFTIIRMADLVGIPARSIRRTNAKKSSLLTYPGWQACMQVSALSAPECLSTGRLINWIGSVVALVQYHLLTFLKVLECPPTHPLLDPWHHLLPVSKHNTQCIKLPQHNTKQHNTSNNTVRV